MQQLHENIKKFYSKQATATTSINLDGNTGYMVENLKQSYSATWITRISREMAKIPIKRSFLGTEIYLLDEGGRPIVHLRHFLTAEGNNSHHIMCNCVLLS